MSENLRGGGIFLLTLYMHANDMGIVNIASL